MKTKGAHAHEWQMYSCATSRIHSLRKAQWDEPNEVKLKHTEERERKSNVNSCVDIRNGSQLQETRRNEWAHEIKNTLHEREYFGFVSYVAAAILCLSHPSTILAGEIVPAR